MYRPERFAPRHEGDRNRLFELNVATSQLIRFGRNLSSLRLISKEANRSQLRTDKQIRKTYTVRGWIASVLGPEPIVRRAVLNGRSWRIVLKNSKIAGSENLANIAHWRFYPLQGSVESIRAPAIVFAVFDVVPHLAARETHQRSSEFSVTSEKGLFQHNRRKADKTVV